MVLTKSRDALLQKCESVADTAVIAHLGAGLRWRKFRDKSLPFLPVPPLVFPREAGLQPWLAEAVEYAPCSGAEGLVKVVVDDAGDCLLVTRLAVGTLGLRHDRCSLQGQR